MKTAMRVVTINIPDSYLDSFKSLIKLDLYASRSQIVRESLKDFLDKELKFTEDIKEQNFLEIRDVKRLM